MRELSLIQIGSRLRDYRTQIQYSRERFSEEVGISSQFLAEIENGKKGMSAETLFKICDHFKLSADYLLLGRISSELLSDPVRDALEKFPDPYLTLTEDMITAIQKLVENTQSKDF